MAQTRIPREEVASVIEARRELGADMEPAVIDAFLDKVDRTIDARVAEEAAKRAGSGDGGTGFVLAIVSLGTGIPITAIAADAGGVQGMVVAWLGIVGVNLAQRFKR